MICKGGRLFWRPEDTESTICAIYIINGKIATLLEIYSAGQFVKECLQAVDEIFYSSKKKL